MIDLLKRLKYEKIDLDKSFPKYLIENLDR